jgi:Uma2 family endonuclease
MSGTPPRLRWTTKLFHNLCDTGLMEGRSVILVNGEIVELPPPNPRHNLGLTLADAVLRGIFGTGFFVRNQMALDLNLHTDPVPDLAFVKGSARDLGDRQATTAALVVEVSDSTLGYDTTTKAELYAAGGIADYWILDVANGLLHVYRDPVPQPDGLGADAYRIRCAYGPQDSVSPLAVPNASVKVAELLP